MRFLRHQIHSWKERREEVGKDQRRQDGSVFGAGKALEVTQPCDTQQATLRPPPHVLVPLLASPPG